MHLQHLFSLPTPVGETWQALTDLTAVGECFPGVSVTSIDGDQLDGTCRLELGELALRYAGSVRLVSRDDELRQAVVLAEGRDELGDGTVNLTVTLDLTGRGDAGTSVAVATELELTGPASQLGQEVVQEASDTLFREFVSGVEQRLATAPADGEAETQTLGAGAAILSASRSPADGLVVLEEEVVEVTVEAGGALSEPGPPLRSRPRAANVDKPAFVRAGAGGRSDTVNLGTTVLPALLRSYAPHLLAAGAGFAVGVLVARGRRR